MVKIEAFDNRKRFIIDCLFTTLLEFLPLITLIASLLALLLLNHQSYITKMEAFDDSHFMHQAVRVGHTDHTGSIVFPMSCIFDLK